MEQKDKINNTFLALKFIDFSKYYKSKKNIDKLNVLMIWDVVLNPHKYENKINELLNNKVFSKIYFKILSQEGSIYQPKVVAASSEKVFKRSSEEFDMEIIKSNKNRDVFYLIILLHKQFELPLSNLYVICNDISLRKKLPKFENNRVQMIIDKNDNFLDLLTNYNSEIFIR
tara:strand:- start:273 stop:788 length:516 start_codon:yes stop_codon:yes gene_type:complete